MAEMFICSRVSLSLPVIYRFSRKIPRMEAISRCDSSGTAAAALHLVLKSMMDSVVMESILDPEKSLLWLLFVISEFEDSLKHNEIKEQQSDLLSDIIMGSTPSSVQLFGEGCEIIKGFHPSSPGRTKGETMPESKDDGESDEDVDGNEDDGSDQDDDGGEEYSGNERNEEDELTANGVAGSEDDDDDDDGDDDSDDDDGDDDDDSDDDDDDDDDDESEEDEDQPPPKKRK